MAFHSTAPVPLSAVSIFQFLIDGTAGSATPGTNTVSRCFNVIELPDWEQTHEKIEIWCRTTLEAVEKGKPIYQRLVLEHNFRAYLDSSATDGSGAIGTGGETVGAALRGESPYGGLTYRYASGVLPNLQDRVGVDALFTMTKSDGTASQVALITKLVLVSHTLSVDGDNVTERFELEWQGTHTFTG